MSTVNQAETRPFMAFADATLRGVGQVFLQNHPLTGALFLLALLANSLLAADALAGQGVSALWLFAGALLGTVLSTSTAMLLRLDRQAIQAGLYGYNGTLVGIAIPFFFQAAPPTLLLLVLASALSTVVTELGSRLLGRWQIPVLTAPFVLTTWLALASTQRLEGLTPSAFMPGSSPATPPFPAQLTLAGAGEGLLTGIGQVMLQGHWLAGLLMGIGILVSSRPGFGFALAGSALGLLMGVWAGIDGASLQAGLQGFNPVLTGIALGAVFAARHATVTAILGMVATFYVTQGLEMALTPTGLPALTAPFIVATWIFLIARAIAPRFRPTNA